MDFIKKMAEEFVSDYLDNRQPNSKKIIDSVKNMIYEISSVSDRIKYLSIVLEGNSRVYEQHKLICTKPVDCPNNFEHEAITYFLGQELIELGVVLDGDVFTKEEKREADDKLENVLSELQSLRDGQEIIYNQVVKEIEELKELYYLGKKKWYRQFMGTAVEMTVSGVISETISKSIIESFKKNILNLIS